MNLYQIQTVLTGIVMLLVFLIIYVLVRNLMTYQRRKTEKAEQESTHVGFMVDTFHDLVARLKEKEKELEELKNRAEDRASSVERYNENIFQSVPSGMVSFDRELKVTRMNSAALTMLGLDEQSAAGRSCREIFHGGLLEMITAGKPVERAETAYVSGAGKRLWLGLSISPLRDSDNREIGRLLVFTDLSELKAFQSREELRDRLATLGEMSAGIAHELRNPMAVISGYTKILLKKVDEAQKPAVEAINREVAVMDRIITDFLSFARPVEPVLADLDLRDTIRECVAMLGDLPEGLRVTLDVDRLPVVKADDVLMRQAIGNLIQNAVEAMPDGGELRITGECGEHILLSIADTGHGIPENLREKIFLPFFTTKERGTGLGLAIVHKNIASHGGSVGVEGDGAGTVFLIRLPNRLAV
ncbi:MAG: hypothetical protein OHK006_18440 [Thermodesulfovibrionales bacterium]